MLARLRVVAVVAALTLAVPVAARGQGGGIVGTVHDTAGAPVAHAEVRLSPDGPSVLTRGDGRFSIGGMGEGEHRLLIRRIGFQSTAADVVTGPGVIEIDVELTHLPRLLPEVVASARRARLPRVYERMDKGLGVTVFAEDLASYRDQDVTDLFDRFMPRFRRVLQAPNRCGKEIYFVDGVRTPPASWEKTPPPPTIGQFVSVDDIDAVEVFPSADFVNEDFLLDTDVASPGSLAGAGATRTVTSTSARGRVATTTSASGGAGIRMGSPLQHPLSLTSSCRRVVLIWTKYYRGERAP